MHTDTWSAPHDCVPGLQAAAGGSSLGAPITELALLNTFTLLLWQLKAVQQHDPADGQSTSVNPAVGLGERVLSFCLQLEGIFEASGDSQRLQDCVFRIQADIFLVFSGDKLEVMFSRAVPCHVFYAVCCSVPSSVSIPVSCHPIALSVTPFTLTVLYTALALCSLLGHSFHCTAICSVMHPVRDGDTRLALHVSSCPSELSS